jgi:ribosomal protein L24E
MARVYLGEITVKKDKKVVGTEDRKPEKQQKNSRVPRRKNRKATH